MTKRLIRLLLPLLLLEAGAANAQESAKYPWAGIWLAEGTFFSVSVSINDEQLIVSEVESLGFEWSATPGAMAGSTATLEVSYAGATGLATVQLLDNNTAVVTASSCVPEYLVVCALAINRQARFLRVDAQP